jgi:predicted nucleic acid-binding protein
VTHGGGEPAAGRPLHTEPIIVQLSIVVAVAAYVVADTSAILAVLLDEPEKEAVVEATMGCVLCAPASIRWEVGNAATAGVKKRRLTPERARQLVRDFEKVTIQALDVEVQRAVDLAIELGLYAYDAYILEAARSSGYQLLALDGAVKRRARKMGLPLVELEI